MRKHVLEASRVYTIEVTLGPAQSRVEEKNSAYFRCTSIKVLLEFTRAI